MSVFKINPTLLETSHADSDSKRLLVTLIEQSISPFLPSGFHSLTIDEKPVSIFLTHSLLVRHRESKAIGSRIEVFENSLPIKGGCSYIYKSLGVLAPEENYLFKSRTDEKARICKIIPITKVFTQEVIVQEGANTKMNKLLRCKTPALDDKQGYLVMKNAGTMDLFELLEALDAGIITLNIKEKLQLTYTIIKAVIEQSHNLNLIHTDLKPENFMVNLETMTIILIDYAFATPMDQPRTDKSIHGTKEYLAPEILRDNSITIKSDSFALGLTIAQIWGYLFNLDITPFTRSDQLYAFHSTRTWTHLFEKMPLSALTKDKITKILDALTEFDPAKRIMPADALIQWEPLLNEFDQIEVCHDDPQDSVKPPPLNQSLFTRSPAFFSLASCSEDTCDQTKQPIPAPQIWRRDSI